MALYPGEAHLQLARMDLVDSITSGLLALLQAMSLLLVVQGSSALVQIDQKGLRVKSHENYQAIFSWLRSQLHLIQHDTYPSKQLVNSSVHMYQLARATISRLKQALLVQAVQP